MEKFWPYWRQYILVAFGKINGCNKNIYMQDSPFCTMIVTIATSTQGTSHIISHLRSLYKENNW